MGDEGRKGDWRNAGAGGEALLQAMLDAPSMLAGVVAIFGALWVIN